MKTKRQVTFTFLEHNAVSKNGRVYTTAAVQEMVRRAQEDIAKGVVLSSFATHEWAKTEDPTKMIGKLSRVWEDGTKVKATLDIFGTHHAGEMATVIKEQGIKTVSLRADEYEVSGKKTVIDGKEHDQVSLCHLVGVDFAMRPGISMVNIDPVAYESDETDKFHRELVPCENAPAQVILTEERTEDDMTKEEIEALIAAALKTQAQEAAALEAKRHAHAHQHMGGDGKKYNHEHKHAHGEADVDGKDHDHEHGNPYENLGAYSVADLSRALAERSTAYAAEKEMVTVLSGITANLDTTRAALLTAGIIKESANPLADQLAEAVNEKTTLTETITTVTTERDDLKAKLVEAETAKTKAEEDAVKLAETIANGIKPFGRRVPYNDVLEQVLATSEVKNPDEEIPHDKEYKHLVRDFASAFVMAADEG